MSNGLTLNTSISNLQVWQQYDKFTADQKKASSFGVRGNKFVLITKSDSLLTRIWTEILKLLHIIKTDNSSTKSLYDNSVKVLKSDSNKAFVQFLQTASGVEDDAVSKLKADMGATIKKLQEENDSLSMQYAAAQIEKSKIQSTDANQIAKLQDEVKQTQLTAKAVYEGTIASLKEELEKSTEDLLAAKLAKTNIFEETKAKIDSLVAEITGHKSKLAEYDAKVKQLTSDKEKLQKDHHDLGQHLTTTAKDSTLVPDATKALLDNLHAQIADNKTKLAEHADKIAHLTSEKEALQKSFEEQKAQLVQQLGVLLKGKDQAEAMLTTATSEMQTALNALQQEHEALKKSAEEKHCLHKKELQALDESLQGKLKELEDLKAKHQNETQALLDKQGAVQKDLDAKSAEHAKAQQEINGHKETMDNLIESITEQKDEIAAKQKALEESEEAHKQEVEKLHEEIQDHLKSFDEYKVTSDKVIASLKSEIETLKQKLESKDKAHAETSTKLISLSENHHIITDAFSKLKAELEEAKTKLQSVVTHDKPAAHPSSLESVVASIKATLASLQNDIQLEKAKQADAIKDVNEQKFKLSGELEKLKLPLKMLIQPTAATEIRKVIQEKLTDSITHLQGTLQNVHLDENKAIGELEALILKLQADIEHAEQETAALAVSTTVPAAAGAPDKPAS